MCIIISVIASVQGTLFMKTLIDDYITPLIGAGTPDYTGLLHELIRVGSFYLIGILATFVYNKIMVYVTQGTLDRLRREMFDHMENFRSDILIHMLMAILCQCIPMMWIH